MKDTIRTICEKYRDTFSGALLASDGQGPVFSMAGGLANCDWNIPNDLSTRFDCASVTKTFTAAATLLLVDRGLLLLDERITEVVDLAGTKIPGDVIIEQLLNHTSGIADDADEEAGEAYEDLFIETPNYAFRTCADFLPNFAYKNPVFKAGTDVRYNNCAFILLGLALEKRTGTDYRTFVAENILAPLGLENTAFLAKDEVCPGAAEGYFAVKDDAGNFIKWKKNIYSYPPVGTPDGGIYTTVGDLDKFLRALKAGRLLSPESTEALFAPHCAFSRPAPLGQRRTGYGFEFIERERDGRIARAMACEQSEQTSRTRRGPNGPKTREAQSAATRRDGRIARAMACEQNEQTSRTRRGPNGPKTREAQSAATRRDGRILCMLKEGYNAGVEAMFSYYPALDLTLNILSNGHGAVFPMNRELGRALTALIT